MIAMTAGELELNTRGFLERGSRDTPIIGISIDSRTLKPGELFFAIRGPRHDGHRFIPDALSKGALGIVADRGFPCPEDFPERRLLLKVQDTHQALKDLAASKRRRWPGTVVAVTGSMGKTTTKEFAAQILRSKFRVYQTPGNYNNLFGLPLALWGLDSAHDVAIFEMGMSSFGEIEEMCRIAAPSIGIITNVAPVHLEFFNSIEDIARAKAELVEALPRDGFLIYNADDLLVSAIADRFEGCKYSFGFSNQAEFRAQQVRVVSLLETRFRLFCRGSAAEAALPFAGAHYIMNALAGIALGHHLGIEIERMVETLSQLRQPAMRGEILRFEPGFVVIDDSYNSSPKALMQMIEVLSSVPSFARRILLAGEMLELGKDSELLHFECGVFAAARKIDLVLAVQGAACEIVRGARESGMSDSQALFFPDVDSAMEFICNQVRANDLILIKGSRAVHMERIVHYLLSRFGVATRVL